MQKKSCMWELLSNPSSWIALITLVLFEVVLGIDNLLFLAILSGKLPENQQKKARRLGLFLAMLFRLGFLLSISLILNLKRSWLDFKNNFISGHISGQNIILLLGGLFLIYKSVQEIRHKVIHSPSLKENDYRKKNPGFGSIILQIVFLDMVFSIDSLLAAIGLISLKNPPEGFGQAGLFLMALAIIITVAVMLFFSESVSSFIQKYPSLQMLGLCFLMLIGLMLISEAAQLGNWNLIGYKIKSIPKGCLYFAIFFSLIVELLNSSAKKMEKTSKPSKDS